MIERMCSEPSQDPDIEVQPFDDGIDENIIISLSSQKFTLDAQFG
jgi:hypothetical protein